MSVFRTTRESILPDVRGNVRPDAFDKGAPGASPLTGSLLIETGDLFLLEDGTSTLLLE